MGWCKELVWLNSTANCKPAADPVVTRRPCWKDQCFVLPGRSLPFLKLKFWVSVLYWSWSMTWCWRHAPRSPQLTLSYKNTLQVTQHGLSLNAEDEQAWPNLYGQQSHSLKFTLQKMQARAPQQPATSKPFRATLKITLSGITTTMSMRTKGQLQLNPVTLQGSFTYCKCCSAVLNFSRKSLHTAMPRGLQWQKVHLKSCALIQQVTSAGEYFPLLQPPRNTTPGIEAQEERKHDSANFLLAEQLLHELMCCWCKVLLCHLPSADSLHSQPGYLASGPTTDKSRKIGCFKLQHINKALNWTSACLWWGPITPQVQYQFSKWLN